MCFRLLSPYLVAQIHDNVADRKVDDRHRRDYVVLGHVPDSLYPEGNKRHLAAESALFARIVTEGMFGFVPTGYDSFTLTPSVPRELGEVKLKKLHACGHTCDITVKRSESGYSTTVTTQDGMTRVYETAEREKIEVKL